MAINTLIKDTENRMKKSEESLRGELARIRAGVANASLLTGIEVDYYGAATPLQSIASITVPEARMLVVTPYDKSALENIEHAINASDIGIAPTNDGDKIRLVVPALTTERRKELSKLVGKDLEEAKVAVRHIRRDAIDTIKQAEKDSEITEDDQRRMEEDIQKVTDQSIARLEDIAKEKEEEIMNG
ncbi:MULTISPECIES: ribosome recycling factor [Aerococcus]|uniref:Ribosome-recycling factor n=1 Tax=Aerococcus sanguinicola TaxID=119206 RepID=A0A5N1GLY9_9LACT|nr:MULTISPECIES: ribosome recycling factor [Aerococcus]KAA9301987.1 ribosome recycling factor [Aerococcus sanguinicola]MDK6368588.1 ribosome recycling factor [Aerococcus sp. UMB9870]MDK6679671.1 ribosome recycling factor [Aerococcus sp. UMB8608]MDK6686515.1 ribosome recycling factor [Aerococcus sp. UMB8623]MDK6940863.1 ribosome recycling factor [Aerococcus sp. UMB8487]